MPAQTHQHREPVTVGDVLDLIVSLIAGPDDGDEVDRSTSLRDLGLDGDLAILHLWDAAVEEFAERSSAELDISALFEVTTVRELADAIVHPLRISGRHTDHDIPGAAGDLDG